MTPQSKGGDPELDLRSETDREVQPSSPWLTSGVLWAIYRVHMFWGEISPDISKQALFTSFLLLLLCSF